MQISAPKFLKPYIKHYLFLRNNFDAVKSYRLFTDGNMGLVISLNGDASVISTLDNSALPTSYIYGQIEEYKDIVIPKKGYFVIVVFQPMGLYALLGTPVQNFSNHILEPENILGDSSAELHEQLFYATDLDGMVTILNNYFRRFIPFSLPVNFQLIHAAIDHIIARRGELTINELSQYIGYSNRQTQRLFNESIGISPLKFVNIAKLHNYLGILKCGRINLTNSALESGYFDQSHLNRVFKNIVGVSPKQYIHSIKPTINLIGIE